MSEQQNTTYNEEFDEIPIEKLTIFLVICTIFTV